MKRNTMEVRIRLTGNDPWLNLDVPQNMRDLGGVPVAGGSVRPGTLFRSDSLVGLSNADIARLTDEVGIRTVIDLRTFEEVGYGRTELVGHGVDYHHIPVYKSMESFEERKDAPRSMKEGYLDMFENSGPGFVRAIGILASPGALPAVFHCTAGKDRTGILASALLSLLGATQDAIAREYALTALRIDRVKVRLQNDFRYADIMKLTNGEVFASDPETILGLLETVEDRYGGVKPFLVGAGLDDSTTSRFQALVAGADLDRADQRNTLW